jgi:hypothetical protein
MFKPLALLGLALALLASALVHDREAHRGIAVDPVSSSVSLLAAAPTAALPVHSGVLRSSDSFREIIPPDRFQRDSAALTIYASQEVIAHYCGPLGTPGAPAVACSGKTNEGVPILFAPNPCLLAEGDLYAAILCHELGHLNGWPKEHGD